jgi:hypothetical protein
VQQAALAVHERTQAGAHAVEVVSQFGQLVAGHGRRPGAELRREIPGRRRFERQAQRADRA